MLETVFMVLLVFSSADVESKFAVVKKLKFAVFSPKNGAPVFNHQVGVALSLFHPVDLMPFI